MNKPENVPTWQFQAFPTIIWVNWDRHLKGSKKYMNAPSRSRFEAFHGNATKSDQVCMEFLNGRRSTVLLGVLEFKKHIAWTSGRKVAQRSSVS